VSGSFLVIFQRLRTGRKKRDSTTGIRCSLSDIYCKFLAVSQASKPIKMLLGGHTRFGRKEPFTRAIEMVVHIGATSQIRLNDPCKAAMRPYVELLRPPVTPSPIGERSIVMSLSVCVFVCSRSYLWNYTSDLHQIFVHITRGRGSVLLWRRSDNTLCTSGFMDDVIFAREPRLLDVAAQLKRSAHAA